MVEDRCAQEMRVEVRCVKEFRVKVLLVKEVCVKDVKVWYVKAVCVCEGVVCVKVLWVKEWCWTRSGCKRRWKVCVCVCVKELCERVAWDRSGVRLRH